MKKLIFLLSIFLFTACSSQRNSASDATNLRVNHYKQTAIGLSPQLVLLVQEDEEIGGDSWTPHFDEIEGFDFEPGFIYNLQVKKTFLQDPPQDASAIHYELLEIVKKERVDEEKTFDLLLKLAYDDGGSENFVTGDLQSGFKILDELQINCNDLCETLDDLLQSPQTLTGVFQHQGEDAIYLIDLQTK